METTLASWSEELIKKFILCFVLKLLVLIMEKTQEFNSKICWLGTFLTSVSLSSCNVFGIVLSHNMDELNWIHWDY